ncbi:MAG TPA: VWA domain-containing protein [Pyrinomonadaceae bacterium]|nr:VWA domain-containing protein [Pyrinomonadaceae bacterium]
MRTILWTVLTLAMPTASIAAQERQLYVSVQDSRSMPVAGLGIDSFRVFENGKERTIKSVVSRTEPVSVGFVFDMSGTAGASVVGRDTDLVAASVRHFVKRLETGSDYFLVGFTDRSVALTEWTGDPKVLARGLSDLKQLSTNKSGPLFDISGEAIKMAAAGKNKKKLLILFTDGRETNSKQGRNEVIRLAESAEVTVYSVGLTDGRSGIFNSPEKSFLERVAWVSGGEAHVLYTSLLFAPIEPVGPGPDGSASTEVSRMFDRLADQLANQYIITYSLNPPIPARPAREINVKLLGTQAIEKQRGGLAVRFRRKYADAD